MEENRLAGDYLMKDRLLKIRKMTSADYVWMAKWLSTPEILEYYGDPSSPFTFEQVIEKYRPRVDGEVDITPYIVEKDGTPFGFMQSYQIDRIEQADLDFPSGVKIYGMDQFIGDPSLFGHGYGTWMVRTMTELLFQKKKADIIIMDPAVSNVRAIACYEKCGFVKIRKIHNGENWLMTAKRPLV